MRSAGEVSADFSSWDDGIDRETRWSLRSTGRWLLWVGTATLLAGVFLPRAWAAIGLGTAIVGALLCRPPIHRLAATWIGAAFVAWLLFTVGLAVARQQDGAVLHLPTGMYVWTALPLVAVAARDDRWRRWALRATVASALVACGVAVMQFCVGLTLDGQDLDAATGLRWRWARGFASLNLAYGFMVALLAVVMAQPSVVLGLGPVWTWCGRAASLVGLAVCGSRAAVLGGVAGIVSALGLRGGWRWAGAALLVGVSLSGLFIARMAWSESERLSKTTQGEDGRLRIWRTTLLMIPEHPVVGMGGKQPFKAAYNAAYVRTGQTAFNKYTLRGGCPHAHNWLLSLLVEHGFPAVLLHAGLVGSVLWLCWRRRAASPDGWRLATGVTVVISVSSLFEPYPVQPMPGLMTHACLGLAVGMALASRRERLSVPADR